MAVLLNIRDLKACFITGTLAQGGAERQLFYMVRTLKRLGGSPSVLSLTSGDFWEAPIRALGVPVIWVGQSHNNLLRLAQIIRTVRRMRPHLVQSAHLFTNVFTASAALAAGIPGLGASRNSLVEEMNAQGKIKGQLCLRMPQYLAANSKASQARAVSLGRAGPRTFHLPNVIDTAYFSGCTSDHPPPLKLLGLGRLIDQKRFDRFLRVAARLRAQSAAPVCAQIVGGGPRRAALEQLAGELGLGPEEVEFSGKAGDPRQAYCSADIFLLTSDFEGTPNVVLEAMACGLPVVAANVGDVSELVIDGQTGFLVERDNEDELARRVLWLLENPQERRQFSRNARERVVQHFSENQLQENLLSIYEKILHTAIESTPR
jgi:hypothetical protein